MNDILAPARHRATQSGTLAAPADMSRRYSVASLRRRIATWREQIRFRWDLKQMAKDNPHWIDDIGLTRRQAEEEIAKLPFLQR